MPKCRTELEGRGIGSRLVSGTLDLIRGRGEKVIPACSFVAAFIRKHAEYQDLLAKNRSPQMRGKCLTQLEPD